MAPSISGVYPSALRQEVRRAAKLAGTLAGMASRVSVHDPCFPWLVGRADEVRIVVGEVLRGWSDGRMDARHATERIRDFLRAIDESLGAFLRAQSLGARVEGSRRPRDTLVDREEA